MKRTRLSALTVLVASTAHWSVNASTLTSIAAAAEPTSFNLQQQRLEALDHRTKTTVHHKIQVEYLNNQTKTIEAIQVARLDAQDDRTKAIENIQTERLNALDASTKTVVR